MGGGFGWEGIVREAPLWISGQRLLWCPRADQALASRKSSILRRKSGVYKGFVVEMSPVCSRSSGKIIVAEAEQGQPGREVSQRGRQGQIMTGLWPS